MLNLLKVYAADFSKIETDFYGLGGIIVPFPVIKLIDMLLAAAGWA